MLPAAAKVKSTDSPWQTGVRLVSSVLYTLHARTSCLHRSFPVWKASTYNRALPNRHVKKPDPEQTFSRTNSPKKTRHRREQVQRRHGYTKLERYKCYKRALFCLHSIYMVPPPPPPPRPVGKRDLLYKENPLTQRREIETEGTQMPQTPQQHLTPTRGQPPPYVLTNALLAATIPAQAPNAPREKTRGT